MCCWRVLKKHLRSVCFFVISLLQFKCIDHKWQYVFVRVNSCSMRDLDLVSLGRCHRRPRGLENVLREDTSRWRRCCFPHDGWGKPRRGEARRAAGAVSQGAGAWPAVGTAATLTDLSCERAPRANSHSNAGEFNNPWIICYCTWLLYTVNLFPLNRVTIQ